MTTAILMLDIQESDATRRVLGCIQVTRENRRRNLPLSAVQVKAKVADRLAHVTVKETFKNPYNEALEAVYVFPLSGGCAVSSFEMKVGDRNIVGKVSERQAARQQYHQAMQQGKRTALLEQERDDVFTVQVGNLPPGEEVTVVLTYSEKLSYFDNGTTEIRLPLVVAPRYIPGQILNRENVGDGVEFDTDLVADASRITPPRLAAGVDPKIALNLSVELVGDQVIEDLSCSQHATRLGTSKEGVVVSLSREDDLLDRDFVLRWRVASEQFQSNLLVYRNPEVKDECFGMISLLPPRDAEIASPARDVVFVVDRSGSMGGQKMTSAARACSLLLATLGPKDRFAIQAFDDVSEWMNSGGNRFSNADEVGKDAGHRYLRTITARGGTEMHLALQQSIDALKARRDKSRRMPVIVVLTDGEVGHEGVILKQVQSQLEDARVFTVGIDTAVNDGFLRRLASVGGGTATFVEPGAQLEDALSAVGREIGAPYITNLTIEDINCGLDKKSIAPSRMSDVFEGRPSSAFFRFSATKLKELQSARVRIKGIRLDGSKFSEEVRARVIDMPALAQLWAKSYIFDLEDQYRVAAGPEQNELHQEIVNVSINHSVLTKFTAFIVVDHAEIVNAGGDVRKIVQPVHMPAKWATDTSVNQSQYVVRREVGGWGSMAGNYGCAPRQPLPQSAPSPNRSRMTNAWDFEGETGFARQSLEGAPLDALFKQGSVNEPGDSSWGSSSPVLPPGASAPLMDGSTPARPSAAPSNAPVPGQSPPVNSPRKDALDDAPLGLAESIRRKISEATAKDPADQASESGSVGGGNKHSNEKLEARYKYFQTILNQTFEAIRSGNKPNANELDDARVRLLSALANSELALRLPLLQKFLRAEVIRLIASIDANSGVSTGLQRLAIEQEQLFKKVAEEAALIETSNQPFWRAGI